MNIRHRVLGSLFTTTLLFSSFAIMAQDNQSAFYTGLGLGFSSLENSSGDVSDFIEAGTSDFDTRDSKNTYKVFIGYRINPIFAVEANYTDLGKVRLRGNSVANTDIKTKAYGASVIGHIPFGQLASVYGRLGLNYWDSDVRGNLGDSSISLQSQSGTDPLYGIGLQLNFSSLLVRAEYERLDMDSNYKLDSFTVSAGVHF
ncbi:outer membrane beta-barrel protein [Marinospirillum alkaliphilum]|uniref:Outer membrane protein beta-barrel domain-containing protein n=1 Tax=Marinospirillum alkaliphilum DSM 21637 TaxID=1122209 RepID=A0A1K1YTB8_9GAMM|nr:outer membrane beta-barrel protein [Marinospirillum alkaliphilum]SFX65166.1 Outer membrane protein beta-barrel domain-containing protein [Marinospirillum alkaliphilum DSM 21637]